MKGETPFGCRRVMRPTTSSDICSGIGSLRDHWQQQPLAVLHRRVDVGGVIGGVQFALGVQAGPLWYADGLLCHMGVISVKISDIHTCSEFEVCGISGCTHLPIVLPYTKFFVTYITIEYCGCMWRWGEVTTWMLCT